MAAPPCMSDDGNQAVFVGTMLQTGDAVALCDECLVAWSAALLNAMTGVDPTPFLQAISDGPPERPEPADEPPAEPADAGDAGTPATPIRSRPARASKGTAAPPQEAEPASAGDTTEPDASADAA